MAVACLVLSAVAVRILWWQPWRGPAAPLRSADQYRRILSDTRVALGLLENETELPRAADLFAALVDELPDEELPRRNLAIARLLIVEHEDPSRRTPELQQATQAALEDLAAKHASAAANWLIARFLEKLSGVDDTQRARRMIEYLETAERMAPREAAYPMAIYETGSISGDAELENKAFDALGRAYAAAPNNLRVAGEWMAAQAERRDPALRETLSSAIRLVGPLVLSIRSGDNVKRDDGVAALGLDVLDLLNQAVSAIEASQWENVATLVRRVRNGIGPMIAHRNDVGRVAPHPLEFALRDYSDGVAHEPIEPTDRAIDWHWSAPAPVDPDGVDGIRDFAFADFDRDGTNDWCLLTDKELRVHRGLPGGGIGESIAAAPLPPGSLGMRLADLDNDHRPTGPVNAPTADPPGRDDASSHAAEGHTADLDVVVFGARGLLVFENRLGPDGTRSLEPIRQPDSVAAWSEVETLAMVDFDHDADLDLVLASGGMIRCASGRGNGEFEDITRWSNLPSSATEIRRIAPVDWDRDVDLDLLVAPVGGHAAPFLENLLHGHLAWTEFGDSFARLAGATDMAVAEIDGRPSWDLVVARTDGIFAILTETAHRGRISTVREVPVSRTPIERLLVADWDNNGFVDILAWSKSAIELWLGRGGPEYADGAARWTAPPAAWSDARAADVDRDGDLDLLALHDGNLSLYRNEGGNANGWLDIRLVGQCDNRGCAGHTGIGSLLESLVGERYQARVVESETAHFGLGAAERADLIRIVWTNGVPQAVIQPDRNQHLTEVMTLKGSCPYVYTWTGSRFEFFTDCLWAAPLGMQVARGVGASSRPWEYLRIPGDRLMPRDGAYEVRLTEELWEAAYFDHVKLMAVDHPADIEVFTNEKVGPPEIAEFQLHPVRQRRMPTSAVDARGADVRDLLAREDDRCAAPWRRRYRQGLTDEHFIELDLGPLPNPEQVTLFLTGWIYPTNTSLNVSFSEHPELDGPRHPSVWTPDANGAWREVIPFMGFPGGKTKTIAVDLSRAFVGPDYRVRIVTTAEIYWDAAFFTIDEPPAAWPVVDLPVATADLRHRGFSERIPYSGQRPERYDYERVTTDPRWPPMRGAFTRYGDVRELLEIPDDRMVVMAAGDELALRFAVPHTEVPDGYRRDFILHSVGWDKDADLNTIHGQTVEPLPFRAMGRYPYAIGEGPEGTEYADYLRLYQTREQGRSPFWRWMVAPEQAPLRGDDRPSSLGGPVRR